MREEKTSSMRAAGVAMAAVFLLLTLSPPALGQDDSERILSFHSEIKVDRDASMTVRETIKVRCLRQKIQRGIFRDFPTRYKDRNGFQYSSS